jgi:hypothetical protein
MLIRQISFSRVVVPIAIIGIILLGYNYASSDLYSLNRLRAFTTTTNLVPQKRNGIVYDINKPLSVGCEKVVSSLQLKLINDYSEILKGIRYVNIWGYLGTIIFSHQLTDIS